MPVSPADRTRASQPLDAVTALFAPPAEAHPAEAFQQALFARAPEPASSKRTERSASAPPPPAAAAPVQAQDCRTECAPDEDDEAASAGDSAPAEASAAEPAPDDEAADEEPADASAAEQAVAASVAQPPTGPTPPPDAHPFGTDEQGPHADSINPQAGDQPLADVERPAGAPAESRSLPPQPGSAGTAVSVAAKSQRPDESSAPAGAEPLAPAAASVPPDVAAVPAEDETYAAVDPLVDDGQRENTGFQAPREAAPHAQRETRSADTADRSPVKPAAAEAQTAAAVAPAAAGEEGAAPEDAAREPAEEIAPTEPALERSEPAPARSDQPAEPAAVEPAARSAETGPAAESRPALEAAPSPAAASEAATRSAGPPKVPSWIRGGEAQPREAAPGPVEIDAARFLNRVSRAFQAAQERGGEVRLRLHPPELGTLRLELRIQENSLTALLETETLSAKTALLDNLPVLRERLAEQGFRIDRFEVNVADRQSGGPPDRPADRQPDEPLPRERPAPAAARRGSTAGESAPRTPAANGRLNVIV